MASRITAETFDQQMTATLKAKKVKNMGDLIKHYKSITEALDETAAMGLAETGKLNYENAKNLTLRFKKRGADFDELKKLWGSAGPGQDDDQTGGAKQVAPEKPINVAPQTAAIDNNALAISEIKSDKDLVIVLSSMIQEAFYNPETGLWSRYDADFKRESYTALGKPGWQSDKDGAAREPINRKKNEEVGRLMESEFTVKVIETVFEHIRNQVYDIKRKEVKHGVRNHVRFHLYALIYPQQ